MKTPLSSLPTVLAKTPFPDMASLSALRAWYSGMSARDAVSRYLPHVKVPGQSARWILGRLRQHMVVLARERQREDLAKLFQHEPEQRHRQLKAITRAIETLRSLPLPVPQISDDIGLWLSPRAVWKGLAKTDAMIYYF